MWPSNVKKHKTPLIYLKHTHTHAHITKIYKKNLDSDRHSFIYMNIQDIYKKPRLDDTKILQLTC